MRRLWLALSARLEAMRPRERLLVGAAIVLPAIYIVYALFIGPALTERRTLDARIAKQSAELAAVEQALRDDAAQRQDPDAPYRQREADLRKQLAEADESIKALHRTLVPAQRVPVLMREMLARDTALQLQSLRTLPAEALLADPDRDAAAKPATEPAASPAPRESADRGVYKHGVEITVRGSYSALHAYLARLERSPLAMYWWRAQLAADERAVLTLTITIYTLSLDKGWLEV